MIYITRKETFSAAHKLSRKEWQKIKKFWMDLSDKDRDVLGIAALNLNDLELLENHDIDL